MDKRFDIRTTVNGVLIDQVHGAGNVPNNQEVGYRGFVVMMRPLVFLAIAAPIQGIHEKLRGLADAIRAGNPIASPFLKVEFPEHDGVPVIGGHEGRHRMLAVWTVVGNVEVPVHIFPYGMNASQVSDQMVSRFRSGVVREETATTVSGPLFADALLSGRLLPDRQVQCGCVYDKETFVGQEDYNEQAIAGTKNDPGPSCDMQ